MDTIQIKDKQFTVSIKEQDIQKEVIRVANEINRDLAGKNPLFLSVLNGSFMFTADLLKHLSASWQFRRHTRPHHPLSWHRNALENRSGQLLHH